MKEKENNKKKKTKKTKFTWIQDFEAEKSASKSWNWIRQIIVTSLIYFQFMY